MVFFQAATTILVVVPLHSYKVGLLLALPHSYYFIARAQPSIFHLLAYQHRHVPSCNSSETESSLNRVLLLVLSYFVVLCYKRVPCKTGCLSQFFPVEKTRNHSINIVYANQNYCDFAASAACVSSVLILYYIRL